MNAFHVPPVTNQTINKPTASNVSQDSPPKTVPGVKNVQQPASPQQLVPLNVFPASADLKPMMQDQNACLAQQEHTLTLTEPVNHVQRDTFPTAKVPVDATNVLSDTKHLSIALNACLAILVSSLRTATAVKLAKQDTSRPTPEHHPVSHVHWDTETHPTNPYAPNAQQDHHPNQERSVHHADPEKFQNQEDHAFLAQPRKVTSDLQTDVIHVQLDQVQKKEVFACNAQREPFPEWEDTV